MSTFLRFFRRWPRGCLLRGYWRYDDRKTTVKLRYTGAWSKEYD